jgi:hypothetical protein
VLDVAAEAVDTALGGVDPGSGDEHREAGEALRFGKRDINRADGECLEHGAESRLVACARVRLRRELRLRLEEAREPQADGFAPLARGARARLSADCYCRRRRRRDRLCLVAPQRIYEAPHVSGVCKELARLARAARRHLAHVALQ